MKKALLFRVLITVTLGLSLGLTARRAWIRGKVSALSATSSNIFDAANAELPAKKARRRIVLIGDSRIAQWPATGWPGEWEVVNRGISGETTTQLSQRFRTDAIAIEPDVIVIESGINDLVAASFMGEAARRAIVVRTTESLLELAETGFESGSDVIVATVIPPAKPDILRLPVWRESIRALVIQINTGLRQAQLSGRVRLLDFSKVLGVVDDRTLPDAYRVDTLHMNVLAYERLTAAVETSLIQMSANRKL